jgi:hypothetical protein
MILALLVLAACGTQSDTPSSRDSASGSGTIGPAPALVEFDPMATHRGDTIFALVVDSIAAQRTPAGETIGMARFEGPVVLSGLTFSHPDGADYPFPCFEADTASARRLPRWAGDTRRPWFCFENRDDAKMWFGGATAGVSATIRIDRFTIHRNLSDAVNSARLLEIVSGFESMVSSSARCFSTTGSVLGRAPGTAAPAPRDVTGRVRLEGLSVAGNDSATARLADSDGRSLAATWRRIGGDSITVMGFNDFVRVEMRLAVTEGRLSGSATATSDAAAVRDSSGRVTPFRRQWTIDAASERCA